MSQTVQTSRNHDEPEDFPLNVPAVLELLIDASDDQVADKEQERPGIDVEDFMLSCDALNCWRVLRRFELELGVDDTPSIFNQLKGEICRVREYDPDEFDLALAATEQRVRLPFGMEPLAVAHHRAISQPLLLLDEALQHRRLLAQIAGVAFQLHKLECHRGRYILLPVEKLRQLFGCRKVAITGALKLLVDYGMLEVVRRSTGQGRATRFEWVGEQGVHFDVQQPLPRRPR